MLQKFMDKSPSVEKALFVAENATVIGDVYAEEGSSIWFGAVLRADSGSIRIGKNTNIQDNSIVHMDPGGHVTIGDNVTIGHGCIIHGCEIGDGSLIGMGAIIMNHAKIGKNCIVGAGTLVTEGKEYPDNSLIVGSPAVLKKSMTEEPAEMVAKNAICYVEEAKVYGGKQ